MHRYSGQIGFVDQMIGPGRSMNDKFVEDVDAVMRWDTFGDILAVVYNARKEGPATRR